MERLVPKIMGWLVVIITLALATTINTQNTAAYTAWSEATNNSTMIGLVVVNFGAPLMILGLLFAGGMMGVAGWRGKMQGASVKDLLEVIGAIIIIIVALSLFSTVIDYVDQLITASSGFAQTIYGLIPIILYIGIIAAGGGYGIYKYRTIKKGKKKKAKTAAMY